MPSILLGSLALLVVGLLLGLNPAGPSDSFDSASDETPEPNNQYLTKKDFRNIGIGLIILGFVLYPIYSILAGGANHYQCLQNMKAISTAMLGYAANYEDRLPPTYVRASDTTLPRLDDRGRPFTWASTLVNIAGFDRKRSFVCPSSPINGRMVSEGLNGEDLTMSYGMYAGMDVVNSRDIDDPANAVLVAETSNGGAENSYDPHPIVVDGKTIDAFLIGWSTGDDLPPANPKEIGNVTRLAWKDSSKGFHAALEGGRHDDTINIMFLDGHTGFLKAKQLVGPKHWPVVPH